MNIRIILWVTIALSLSACRGLLPKDGDQASSTRTPVVESTIDTPATTPQTVTGSGSYLAGDGPGANTPSNLDKIPDAVPHAEPLHRYANRPYTVLGKDYTPLTKTGTYKERGIASWYGKKFHGEKTSTGEVYDMYAMTAAHTTLPIPSYAKVTNLSNHKSVIVRVNDRGPFLHDRIIDLSYTAATKIGIIGSGQGLVEVESLATDDSGPPPISPIFKEPLQVEPLAVEPLRDSPPAAGKVYLQLGAFSSQTGAEKFLKNMRSKLSDTGKQFSLEHKKGLVKVRMGPYPNRDSARSTALLLESRLGFKPILSLY